MTTPQAALGLAATATNATVNADGTYGKWLYAICRKPEDVSKAITAAVAKTAQIGTAASLVLAKRQRQQKMSASPTDWLELGPKVVSMIGGMVGMIGGTLGIVSSLSIRRRDRATRQEYDDMWNTYVAIIELTNAGRGNMWKPVPGSKEHKLAEKMVDKGWLQREQFGGYMLRSTTTSGGSSGLYSDHN